jgi:predicted secreted Zn-dependent protease
MPPRLILPLLLVILLLLTDCTGPSAAKSRAGQPLPTLFPVSFPHATAEFYDVSGSTESEIRAQLSARGPGGYDAYTKWSVRWSWPGQGTAACRLQDAGVSYEITVTFPRWAPTEQATPDLVKKWNGYLYALALHENGHVNNVVSHYPVIVAAITGSTCLSAASAAQTVLQQMREYDIQYDKNTDHGRTQGARFP